MLYVLFVCSRNRLRSPTAGAVFSGWPGVATASAGTAWDTDCPITPELLQWADLVVVMELQHRTRLAERFRSQLSGKRLVWLDIRDDYTCMDPALVALLKARMPGYLSAGQPGHGRNPHPGPASNAPKSPGCTSLIRVAPHG